MNIWTLVLTILVLLGLFTPEVEAKAAKKVVPAKKPAPAKAKKGKAAEEDDEDEDDEDEEDDDEEDED